MAGQSDSRSESFQRLAAFAPPEWGSPGDLSRLSLDTFVARETPMELGSAGALRLTGPAVTGSSVRLDVVGAICSEFQRLVIAVGASFEGVKSARGRISEALQSRSRLSLRASPAPGSIILGLVPEIESSGRPGDGRPEENLFETPEPLADKSVEAIIKLLMVAKLDNPVNEELADVLAFWGPRAASALASLAAVLEADFVDIDFHWDKPEQPRRRVTFSSSDSRRLRQFVARRRLDEADIPLTGLLRTVSDRRSLELQVGDEIYYLSRGDVDHERLAALRVGDEVTVLVSEKVEYKVGGGETRSYTLLSVSPA